MGTAGPPAASFTQQLDPPSSTRRPTCLNPSTQTGGVSQHRLMDRACEFPCVAPSVVGRPHSHMYMVGSRFPGADAWGAPQVRAGLDGGLGWACRRLLLLLRCCNDSRQAPQAGAMGKPSSAQHSGSRPCQALPQSSPVLPFPVNVRRLSSRCRWRPRPALRSRAAALPQARMSTSQAAAHSHRWGGAGTLLFDVAAVGGSLPWRSGPLFLGKHIRSARQRHLSLRLRHGLC